MILQFEFTIRVYIDFLCRVKKIFLTILFLAYQKNNRLKKKNLNALVVRFGLGQWKTWLIWTGKMNRF
jgi:hypothetical protein